MTFEEWLESRNDDWGADLPSRPEDAARLAWNAATLAEREACSKIAGDNYGWVNGKYFGNLSDAIALRNIEDV